MLELKKLCIHVTPHIPNVTSEGQIERIIEHPQFDYCAELGCQWHSKVKTYVYITYEKLICGFFWKTGGTKSREIP